MRAPASASHQHDDWPNAQLVQPLITPGAEGPNLVSQGVEYARTEGTARSFSDQSREVK